VGFVAPPLLDPRLSPDENRAELLRWYRRQTLFQTIGFGVCVLGAAALVAIFTMWRWRKGWGQS
jgi:hypothetical protein